MYRKDVVIILLLAALALGPVEKVGAAIAPGRAAELKQAATDVIQIEVIDVKIDDAKAIKSNTLIKAKIVAVVRSRDGLKAGAPIEIESYLVSTDRLPANPKAADMQKLFDAVFAPMSPPDVQPGWKGTVYMKAKESKAEAKRFGLAAFGHSFEPELESAAE